MGRLFTATRETLKRWIDRLKEEASKDFPEKVTACRKEMAVRRRFGQPFPRCDQPIQCIRYSDNETNYCARCQTGGKVLARRFLGPLGDALDQSSAAIAKALCLIRYGEAEEFCLNLRRGQVLAAGEKPLKGYRGSTAEPIDVPNQSTTNPKKGRPERARTVWRRSKRGAKAIPLAALSWLTKIRYEPWTA
jgi:hypothetical protein